MPVETVDEFEIQEPRLRSILYVEKLLMPPDYRPSYRYKHAGQVLTQTNTDIYIPLLRIPSWHYCPSCKTLHQSDMSNSTSWIDCKKCKARRKMIQVPFVIVCQNGHISDFPWREWVHRKEHPICEGHMRLVTTGGATLDSLKVECSCKKERSLRGIMTRKNELKDSEEGISELSKMLNEDKTLYECPGHKPWYGNYEAIDNCSSYPVATLKNSINVYYPNTISAIYLPGENQNVESLIDMFEKNGVTSSWLNITDKLNKKIELIKKLCPPEILSYENSDIELAIYYIEGVEESPGQTSKLGYNSSAKDLRKKEFETLTQEENTKNLKIRKEWDLNQEEEKENLSMYFNIINRVTKLKETIALTGFNRLSINEEVSIHEDIKAGKRLLFKEPDHPSSNWLPAYKVFGEGIFF